MLYVLQRPWVIPLAILVVASIYFISLSASFPTFFNADSDAPLFIIASKYLRLGHPSPGYPLYALMGSGWLQLTPFLTEVWSLTLFNALASGAVALVLYLITRSFLAPLLWMSAGLVVSQSTILEQYCLTILFMVTSYYFYTKDKRSLAYAIASFGVMINNQAALCILVYIANDLYKHNSLKPILWSLISLPLLLYIPLVNREPYLVIEGNSLKDYWRYFFGQRGVILGLAIIPTDNLVKRLWDLSRILIGGLGVSLILIALCIKKVWKESFVLPLLFILPLFYYFTILNPWAYTYALPGLAFGAILACAHEDRFKFIRNVAIGGAIALIAINFTWYDLGRTLDKDKTAVQFLETLDSLPSDAVIINHKSFSTTMWTMLYNLDNDKDLYYLSWNVMEEYSENSGDIESYNYPKIFEKAAIEGNLYEYALRNPETLEIGLKQISVGDIEYKDFLIWLDNPFRSRIGCELITEDNSSMYADNSSMYASIMKVGDWSC